MAYLFLLPSTIHYHLQPIAPLARSLSSFQHAFKLLSIWTAGKASVIMDNGAVRDRKALRERARGCLTDHPIPAYTGGRRRNIRYCSRVCWQQQAFTQSSPRVTPPSLAAGWLAGLYQLVQHHALVLGATLYSVTAATLMPQ